jgi:hypothetical protein
MKSTQFYHKMLAVAGLLDRLRAVLEASALGGILSARGHLEWVAKQAGKDGPRGDDFIIAAYEELRRLDEEETAKKRKDVN